MPPLIYSLPQKLRAIESLGADALLLIPFDKTFSEQTGEQFHPRVWRAISAKSTAFASARILFSATNAAAMWRCCKNWARNWDFTVHGLAAVSLDGQAVSSTRIREAIRAGDFDAASQMLGRPYAICGKVVEGRPARTPTRFSDGQPGHGWPDPAAQRSLCGSTRLEDRIYRVALNIGVRPTVATDRPLRVEAHLLDFDGDLYGKELEVQVGERLRSERTFATPAELQAQISRDIAHIRSRD